MRLMNRAAGSDAFAEGVAVDMMPCARPRDRVRDGEGPRPRKGSRADDWPGIQERIMAADIFVMGTPIWLGREVERVHAWRSSGCTPTAGTGTRRASTCTTARRPGACRDGERGRREGVLDGDPVRHVTHRLRRSRPRPTAGWIGEAGPGPSYGDVVDGERRRRWAMRTTSPTRNTTFMSVEPHAHGADVAR